ncbi:MAG TPA: thiamine phosphate synthase [Xanthobacteraceae bacterium]|nr:thiamine phosphate synthase [Xanthobacteraceae bacterium]
MRAHPDRFYPIVDTIAWVERLAKLGVRTLQLRTKDLDATAARELVRDALKAVDGTRCEVVINDYWQAAIAEGAFHVHLGQEDIETADVSTIKKSGLTLGISTHDHAELEIALRHQPDYVALGPIYETTLKKMRFAPQGYERISEWKKLIGKIPLIAIGGIKLEHAKDIFAAGADSIAVVSDVTLNADPDQRVRDWLGLVRA